MVLTNTAIHCREPKQSESEEAQSGLGPSDAMNKYSKKADSCHTWPAWRWKDTQGQVISENSVHLTFQEQTRIVNQQSWRKMG